MPDINKSKVTCPNCDKQLALPKEYFGKRVRCPKCHYIFSNEPQHDNNPPAVVVHQNSAQPTSLVAVYGNPTSGWPKAKLSVRFERPDKIVFKAALQAIRIGNYELLSVNKDNRHIRFSISDNSHAATKHNLFVFETSIEQSDLDISSEDENTRNCFDSMYKVLVEEIAKYLMFAVAEPNVSAKTTRRRQDDDVIDRPRRRSRAPRYYCHYCGGKSWPVWRTRISPAGWIVFALMIIFCFPLFWVGLLITETDTVCGYCGVRLG